MPVGLADISCARLPRAAVPQLARLRGTLDLIGFWSAEHLWLRWPVGREDILRQIWPLRHVELFGEMDGIWHRLGESLPFFDMPDWTAARPLHDLLFPAPFVAEHAPGNVCLPLGIRLIPEAKPQPTSAMSCSLHALHAAMESMSRFRFEAWTAARRGAHLLVCGENLPWLPESVRLWGRRVLSPLGFRLTPRAPEFIVLQALDVPKDHLLLFNHESVERIPLDAFSPVSRAGVRLAMQDQGIALPSRARSAAK